MYKRLISEVHKGHKDLERAGEGNSKGPALFRTYAVLKCLPRLVYAYNHSMVIPHTLSTTKKHAIKGKQGQLQITKP